MPVIEPQTGFQVRYLSANANIKIGGGVAGCGKTMALLLSPLFPFWINNQHFNSTIFRRHYPDITMAGGLLDESTKIYGNIGMTKTKLKWSSPVGSSIEFRALQYEKDVELKYQGAQFAHIGFDELTHFTEKMFFYLMSRNRSAHINNPSIYATCNPDPDSFVAKLIEWWIDTDGFPIFERSGINRYFFKDDGNYLWGGSREEVKKQMPDETVIKLSVMAKENGMTIDNFIKSITFIPGKLKDNKILIKTNPSYVSNLYSMSEAERLRYLDGNWKIKLSKNLIFDIDKIEGMMDYTPPKTRGRYITCDAAAHGRDLMVIYVWEGFNVISVSIQKKSDARDIFDEIERLRIKFNVTRNNVVVDADGVGNDVIRLSNLTYLAFHGGSRCKVDVSINKRENYKNLKTQCFYRMAKRVNNLEVGFSYTRDTCWVDGVNQTTITHKGKVMHISELIKQQLRAIRKGENDLEGKQTINSKEDQKMILDGDSPDFADTLMLREIMEFPIVM